MHTLSRRTRPLAADAAELDAFDRAALETLGVSVVVPTRRGETVVAFTCLGPKRSGDIYTPEEIAYLTAVANRCSEVLVRLDDEVVIREARELQRALRRYVPGAVAEELDRGHDLESAEREVTVLFVDMRGYTSFSERRRAEEIFSTLNVYTEKVSGIVRERGGSVVEFHGDGLLAVFGAPHTLERKERAAVEDGAPGALGPRGRDRGRDRDRDGPRLRGHDPRRRPPDLDRGRQHHEPRSPPPGAHARAAGRDRPRRRHPGRRRLRLRRLRAPSRRPHPRP